MLQGTLGAKITDAGGEEATRRAEMHRDPTEVDEPAGRLTKAEAEDAAAAEEEDELLLGCI